MIPPPTLTVLTLVLQVLTTLVLISSHVQGLDNQIHTLMTKDELKSVFGRHYDEIPNYQTARVTLRHLRKRRLSEFSDSGEDYHLLAEIQTTNHSFHLQLRRHTSIIGPSFEIELHHHNYTEIIPSEKLPMPECLYQGKVKSGGEAAVSTCSSKGMIGLIIAKEEHFIIQPLPRRLILAKGVSHVVYKRIDDHECPHESDPTMVAPEFDHGNEDDSLENDVNVDNYHRTTRAASSDKVVETAVFVDDVMYENTKQEFSIDPAEAIRMVVFTMLNGVQLLYNQPNLGRKFKFVLVKLTIITSASKGPNKAKGNIKDYLTNFCQWQEKQNPSADSNPKHWDSGILLSGLNLYQDTPDNHKVIGLAWVSGMCRPTYSCSVNEGQNFETVFVISHELGHNLGMQHDGSSNKCDGSSHIMSPSLGPGKISWSKCSKTYLDQFVSKSTSQCMNDAGTVGRGLDHEKAGGLPGQRFTVYDQCHKAFGTRYMPYAKQTSPFDNVCRELWCLYGKQAKRAHPALEGSMCARGKICKYGECIVDNRPKSQQGMSAGKR